MADDSQYDATPPALGYLYQCRYALLLALQRDDEPTLRISIEKLDDVAFLTNENGKASSVELLQFKHHLNRQAGLTNKHTDVWKSIRIWSEAAHSAKIDLDRAVLLLVTTSVATARHAVRFLRADPNERNPESARTALEAAGQESDSDVVKDCYRALARLSVTARKKLFRSMYLLDGSGNIVEMQGLLENAVRHACRPEHRWALVERLEGWWWAVVIRHLMDDKSDGIAVTDVQQHVHDLREQFRRETLPDDFLVAEVPKDATPDDDTRVFIRQLRLIQISDERIRSAQGDHYKAFAQRSRWVRDNLLDLAESGTFEERLVDQWKQRFEIMRESMASLPGDEPLCVRSGAALYNWTQTDAPGSSSLLIRPEFRSSYMTRGSYHMLADGHQPRIGWHPHYRERLRPNRAEEA
jgi:hypothetical protein